MAMRQVQFEFPDEQELEELEVDLEVEPSSAKTLFNDEDEVVEISGKSAGGDATTGQPGEADSADEDGDDIELEVVDDTPPEDRNRKPSEPPEEITDEELADYSEKVRKRLKHFSKGYHDERRAKEQAIRERMAAEDYARGLRDRVKELESTVTTNRGTMLQQAKHTVARDLEAAKAKFRTAYESGDVDELLAAQEELTKAKLASDRLESLEEEALQPVGDAVQHTQTTQQEPRGRVQPDPKAMAWQQENTWFGDPQHEPETAFALGVHKQLTEVQRIAPDSDEYYEQLNARMRTTFPNLFEDTQEKEEKPTSRQQSSTVVAPATRSTTPRKIKLSKSQLQIAKRLGISPADYAAEVAREMRKQNG